MPDKSPVDLERIARAVREILIAVGEDPDREGLQETPRRVAKMYAEMFSGLHDDPRPHLSKVFTEKYDEVVLVRDISFCSMCEHHLLPFMGRAHVAYLPTDKVLGLSKIPRIVDLFSKRLQVQERMTRQIADFIEAVVHPHGVGVVVEGWHLCAAMRGVRKDQARMVTSALCGTFKTNDKTRQEFLNHLSRGHFPTGA